jgi:peptidoglycan/xylan/chitin deacetylase (PgdA/CDA1 family)
MSSDSSLDVTRRSVRRTARVASISALAVLLVPLPVLAVAPPSAAAPAQDQAATSSVAVVAQPDGSDLVFYRGQDDAVHYRIWSGTGWSTPSSLGGVLVGAPAAAAAGSGIVVVGRGTDGAVWMRTSTGGTWQPWQSIGGIATAAPAVAGVADGRIDVFVRGADDRLYTRARPAGQNWTSWTSLGGGLVSGPAAVALGSARTDVFVTGTDYAIWHRSRTSAGWSAWRSLGGRTYVAPAAVTGTTAGTVRVFIRAENDALQENVGTTGAWGGWTSLGGVLVDAPAAAGTPTGADVVVHGTDNALWARRLRAGVWTGFARAWVPAPPPAPAPELLGVDWTRVPTTSRVIALTFDAGANADGLPSIRATLASRNVPATFFLTGSWTRSFPAQANQVAVTGFRVGNHSDTHPHFPSLTDAQVREEVLNAERTVLLENGADTRPLFRFPYGDVDGRVLADVNALGYVAVRWTVDSLGWQGTSGGMTVQKVIDRVLAAAQPGAIVLMHVGSHPTDHSTLDADALPRVIDGLRARGYGFVTLKALTG